MELEERTFGTPCSVLVLNRTSPSLLHTFVAYTTQLSIAIQHNGNSFLHQHIPRKRLRASSCYPVGYPSFFVFLFVGSFIFPLCFHDLGASHRAPCTAKIQKNTGFPRALTDGYAMLMSPNKGETAVHGCHCPRDMAVRMREVMARPWVGVCVPLALIYC